MGGWVDAIMSPLKSASDMAKGLVEIRDTIKFGNAVIELQTQIVAAQQGAVAALARESEMADEIRGLKGRVAQLEAWDAEKQRYQLTEVGPGALAYVVKPDVQGAEPVHWICAGCYQRGKKSILQSHRDEPSFVYWRCHECSGEIRVPTQHKPMPPINYRAGGPL